MSRSGKEPAEDVVRRIVAACEEAGLIVDKKRTSYQHREDGDFRIIAVYASPPGFQCQRKGDLCFSAIDIETTIGVDGRWCERVSIKATTNDSPLSPEGMLTDPFCKNNAVMHGRSLPFVEGATWEDNPGVAISELVSELSAVLKERKFVQEAIARGEEGPWHFARSIWKQGW